MTNRNGFPQPIRIKCFDAPGFIHLQIHCTCNPRFHGNFGTPFLPYIDAIIVEDCWNSSNVANHKYPDNKEQHPIGVSTIIAPLPSYTVVTRVSPQSV